MRTVTAAYAPDFKGARGIDRRVTRGFPKARTVFVNEFRARCEGLVRTRIGIREDISFFF